MEPVHVAAYVEQLGQTHSAPSGKQHLATVRTLFDRLVVGQVVRGLFRVALSRLNSLIKASIQAISFHLVEGSSL